MSQRVDSWQSESLFPRSWDILLLKMLFLECRGSRMLFYAIFWRYVLSNTAVGWQHKQVSGTDWRSAQPVRKCDIALFLGKQKWLLGKLSVHEIFCNIDLFSFLLASNHQIVDKKIVTELSVKAFRSESRFHTNPRLSSNPATNYPGQGCYFTSITYPQPNIPCENLVGDGELLSHTISRDWSNSELLQLLPPRRRGVRRSLLTGGDRLRAERKKTTTLRWTNTQFTNHTFALTTVIR